MRECRSVFGAATAAMLAVWLAIAGGTALATVPGDVNGDGVVNAIDVQLVINAALGIDVSPAEPDINGDGVVNAIDVQLVINAALGIDICGIVDCEPEEACESEPLVWFVDAAAINPGDGSAAAPFLTLAEGLAAADCNDRVILRAGAYTATAVTVGAGVTLEGESGAYRTRIVFDGDGLSLADGARVQGVTLSLPGSGVGLAVQPDAAATVRNVVVEFAETALRVPADAEARIENSTFVANNTAIQVSGTLLDLRNSMFVGNSIAVDSSGAILGGAFNLFHANGVNFPGLAPLPDTILADPRFVDPDGLLAGVTNYHLRFDSPARNAGDPDPAFNNLDGTRNDLGADGGPFGVRDLTPPLAIAMATPDRGEIPLTVVLDGSASRDEWGIAAYAWDRDARDGIQVDAEGPIAQFTYNERGEYRITLTVTDHSGLSSSAEVTVFAGTQLPEAAASVAPIAGPAPLFVQFNGFGTDPLAGPLNFSWDFDDGFGATEQNPAHALDVPAGAYRPRLTVTAQDGVTASAALAVTITRSPVLAAMLVSPSANATVRVPSGDDNFVAPSVEIPPGALVETLAIATAEGAPGLPQPPLALGDELGRAEFGPDGIALSAPATISIPAFGLVDHSRTPVAYQFDHATQEWTDNFVSGVRIQSGIGSDAIAFETVRLTDAVVGLGWRYTQPGGLGGVNTIAGDINDSGLIAGYGTIFVAANNRRGFFWREGTGFINIGSLDGARHTHLLGLNDAGVGVGYLQPTEAFSGSRAILFDETNGLRLLPEQDAAWDWSIARSINNTGQVAGYHYEADLTRRAFLWDPQAGYQNLGALPGRIDLGQDISFQLALNDNGWVAGDARNAGGNLRAFVWDAVNGMRELGTLGGANSRAFGINAGGEVVGWSLNASGQRRAFIWNTGNGMQALPLPSGYTATEAHGINDDGLIVGLATNAEEDATAVLWEPTDGGYRITILATIAPEPGNPSGALRDARAINATRGITGTTVGPQTKSYWLRP